MVVASLLERLSRKSWRQLLVERVIQPMGLGRTYVDAEDGILHGIVVGNLPDPSQPGGYVAVPKLLLPRTMARSERPSSSTSPTSSPSAGCTRRSRGGQREASRLRGQCASDGDEDHRRTDFRRGRLRPRVDARSDRRPGRPLAWRRLQRRALARHGDSGSWLVIASFVNSSSPGEFQTELHDRLASGTASRVRACR